MPKKLALITGISGQDGSYLAEFLLKKGYGVHGIARRVAAEDHEQRFSRIQHLIDRGAITLHSGDVTDYPTIWNIIGKLKPHEVYHLAAQSQVQVSFEDDFGTFATNAYSTHYFLAAIKELSPKTRFYFAGTSELYGDVREVPQDENTPFNPLSPYAIAKLASFYLVKMYRDAYGIFGCSGILFNHESPRRGGDFVTRKITSTIAKINAGRAKELRVGNLDAKRDWGFAGDYVQAMWLMLQQPKPDDYVVGMGRQHSVREFVELAFKYAGITIIWRGKGLAETGVDKKTKKVLIRVDKKFFRPLEVRTLLSNPRKARRVLKWKPKTTFEELVRMMVETDLRATQTHS